MLVKLAWKSLWARRLSVFLTIIMMTVSVFVLLSVETLRHQTKASFSQTVSGVDLIVGSRTSSLNLLLYSVFHLGQPSNNLSWQSYQHFAQSDAVAWTIPLSLGDSHRGYRVVGTTPDFFKYFKFGDSYALAFRQGHAFNDTFDVVLGAAVAAQLNYDLGQKITLSHGLARNNIQQHADYPFVITGILAPTGTPVDQSLYVSLAGIEAIHRNEMRPTGFGSPVSDIAQTGTSSSVQPTSITAFMVGLQSRMQTFNYQRQVNDYRAEALMAILPGATLFELWRILSGVERVMLLISILVLAGALIGISNMLLVSMRERRYEIAVLRAIGYGPMRIFTLLQIEALLIALLGCGFAVITLQGAAIVFSDYLLAQYSVYLSGNVLTLSALKWIGWILCATFVVALIPAISAYRQALHAHLQR